MKKIESFSITSMTLSGFKCYQEPAEITFGNPTIITGGNGRGKSSIADAIAFAVTGLPFFGERGIDRLHCEDHPDLFIRMAFADETGTTHELTRSRQKDRMTITYDGYEIRQKDLTELFGEKEVFLSIFNPLYFIEELGDDGKKLLERYLPMVRHEDVLAQLSDSVRASLEQENILSPEVYLKKKREEIRELEKDITYTTGQRDLLADQQQNSGQQLLRLQTQTDELEAELATLEGKRCESLDLHTMEDQLVEASAQYSDLSQETAPAADTSELDAKIAEVQKKLGVRTAEQYTPKYAQSAADAAARVRDLGAKYKHQLALLKGFQAGAVCPTCRRAVQESELPHVRAALQTAVDDLLYQGKEVRAQLDELAELERKAEEAFQKFRADDERALTETCERLQTQRVQMLTQSETAARQRGEELERLEQQIRQLAADITYGNLTEVEYDRMVQCREELRDKKTELAALRDSASAPTEDYDLRIAALEANITKAKKLLATGALYAAKRAELLFAPLKLNRVQISLYEVVKSTGEAKDVFKFTYGGRRYDRLSLSEKIRAGMELSELIKRLTGRNYPLFLDNMESVDSISNVRPTGQVIMAKCVHGAPLSIRPAAAAVMPQAA